MANYEQKLIHFLKNLYFYKFFFLRRLFSIFKDIKVWPLKKSFCSSSVNWHILCSKRSFEKGLEALKTLASLLFKYLILKKNSKDSISIKIIHLSYNNVNTNIELLFRSWELSGSVLTCLTHKNIFQFNKEKYCANHFYYMFQRTCFARICTNKRLAWNFEYLFLIF